MAPKLPIDSLEVEFGNKIQFTSEPLFSNHAFKINESEFELSIDGVATYKVKGGRHIDIIPHEGADKESIELFLNGSVLGAVLFQRGIIPLHGSSFIHKGKGVIVCGASGAGKSSVTAAFCKRGAQFINDDISPVAILQNSSHSKNLPEILPIFSTIKLWKDSLLDLGYEQSGLSKIRPSMEKFYLPVDKSTNINIKLDTVIILTTHQAEEFKSEVLTGISKYNVLRRNIYRKSYLRGMPETSKKFFSQLINIASQIDVVLITRPKRARIADTVDFIDNDSLIWKR